MSAHTPGPWAEPERTCECSVVFTKGRSVQRIDFCSTHAAAPEMLEALQMLTEYNEYEWNAEVKAQVRAAIAKATGGDK